MIKEIRDVIGSLRALFVMDGTHGVLARGAAVSLAIQVAGAGLAFAAQALMARLLGPYEYGIYVIVITWIGLALLFSSFGMSQTMTRYVAAYVVQERWSSLRGLLRQASTLLLYCSLVVAAVMAAIVWEMSERFGSALSSAFLVGVVLVPIQTLGGVRQAVLQGFKRAAYGALPESVIRPVTLLALMVLVGVVGAKHLTASYAIAMNLGAATLALFIGNAWMRAALPDQVSRAEPQSHWRDWLGMALPTMAVSGMQLILTRTDVAMLGAMLGPKEAGIYSAAVRLTDLLLFGLYSINAIGGPLISEFHAKNESQKLQSVLAISAIGVFLFSTVTAVILIMAGRWLLSIFGQEFVAGYSALTVLAIGQVIVSLAGTVGSAMTMTGCQNQLVKIFVLGAGSNLLLNYLLVPRLGMVGAAVSTMAAGICMNGLMLAVVRKKLGVAGGVLGIRHINS